MSKDVTKNPEVAQEEVKGTDAEMPEPETKEYNEPQGQPQAVPQMDPRPQLLVNIKPELKKALTETIGNLGYNRELGIPERHIQVWQLFDILKNFENRPMTEQQMNEFLNLVSLAPYNVIAGFMESIKTPEGQEKLWSVTPVPPVPQKGEEAAPAPAPAETPDEAPTQEPAPAAE